MKTFQTYATVDNKFVDNILSIHFSEKKKKIHSDAPAYKCKKHN